MEKIKDWINNNKLNVVWSSEKTFSIPEIGTFYYIQPTEDKIFDESFSLILDTDEEIDCNFYVYEFGGKFYYTDKNKVNNPELNLFKYLGSSVKEIDTEFTYLGVHGKYELLNGTRDYFDWIKKAKFLGIKTLGISEKNTLAGLMSFQLACLKKGITPILGCTLSVKIGSELGSSDIKFYVKDSVGWDNLLSIYKEVSINNDGFILEKDLLKYSKGLVCVIDPKSFKFDKLRINQYKKVFEDIYYQLDTIEYKSEERDKEYLVNLKSFVNSEILSPVLINDSYYLDKEDYYIKNTLSIISGKREYKSHNQYFKDLDDNFETLSSLFKDDNLYSVFGVALESLVEISEKCKFNIVTTIRYLPKYIMNEDEKHFKDSDELFWHLIEKGLSKCPQDQLDKYIERIEYEYELVKSGDVIDYFLILADVIRYCKENNILVGHARGSAAGSLISYVLDITQVDPIKWDLLFERFLNSGRILKSLPDIDIDVQPSRKEEVKNYLKTKYTQDSFCYIGTYTSLQLKGCIKELARIYNLDFSKTNYITSILDLENETWDELFKNAVQKPPLKEFILENPDLFNDIPLILGSLKAQSIHACATLLTPVEKDIYHWIPLHLAEKDGDKILVSCWEGEDLADSGFLKEDILVIDQLDKYRFCLDLIKETTGDEVDIYNLPLDEEGVFDLFRKGFNSDIFQFGGKGLTNYLKELKPDNINELIDATALYRPGAMEVNSHNEYVLRKFGEREIKYGYGLKEVTKTTNGVICYQEQVMKACQVLGGFSLMEADDIRKAIVKKRDSIIQGYKEQFIKGALKNGCPKEEAHEIWHELEVHGSYSFNRSHAAAYTLISYAGQWLKYHYPIQFWTTALQCVKQDAHNSLEENISKYISEINKLETIKVIPPDINYSDKVFHTEYKEGKIFWSLSKIKFCGDVAVDAILEERNKNGHFYSFSEFISRVEKRKINKRIVLNLIIAGAFDQVEDIKSEKDRIEIINSYYKLTKTKRDSEDDFLTNDNVNKDYWWTLQQKKITGYGFIDYKKLLKMVGFGGYINNFIESNDFFNENNEEKDVVVAGVIQKIIVKTNKKGEYCKLELESNNEIIGCLLWSDQFSKFKHKIMQSEGKIMFIKTKCKFDSYSKTQSLYSNEDTELEIID